MLIALKSVHKAHSRSYDHGMRYTIVKIYSMGSPKGVDLQGVSKKRYFFDFCPISVLEVGFYFFICVSESEFRAHSI